MRVYVFVALTMRAWAITIIAGQLDRVSDFILPPGLRGGFLQPRDVHVPDGPREDRVLLANEKSNISCIIIRKFIHFAFFFVRTGGRTKVQKWTSKEFNQR